MSIKLCSIKHHASNIVLQFLALLLCVWEILVAVLSPQTRYTDALLITLSPSMPISKEGKTPFFQSLIMSLFTITFQFYAVSSMQSITEIERMSVSINTC